MNRLHNIGRKLENDECFGEHCSSESVWKIIYREGETRFQTRLCDACMTICLIAQPRPRALIRIERAAVV